MEQRNWHAAAMLERINQLVALEGNHKKTIRQRGSSEVYTCPHNCFKNGRRLEP
jgi:hypothetical protein